MTVPVLFTVGHSTLGWREFTDLLVFHNIDCLVDVRSFPGSSKFPQFGKRVMGERLWDDEHIDYVHLPTLGGRRSRSLVQSDSVSGWWRNASFRNFAEYMQTGDFLEGIEGLLFIAKTHNRTAYMCSEAVPWRCHRSMITDYLLLSGRAEVYDLIGSVSREAKVHEGAEFLTDKVIYPPAGGAVEMFTFRESEV